MSFDKAEVQYSMGISSSKITLTESKFTKSGNIVYRCCAVCISISPNFPKTYACFVLFLGGEGEWGEGENFYFSAIIFQLLHLQKNVRDWSCRAPKNKYFCFFDFFSQTNEEAGNRACRNESCLKIFPRYKWFPKSA